MAEWQIAIETSGFCGTVALLNRDITVRQLELAPQLRTATTLAPAIDTLLGQVRASGTPLRLVSVTSGPGSFTGLRIGVTAAKTLAFALQCDLVSCDTLAVLLSRLRKTIPPREESSALQLDAAINAYRGQVFWRRETFGGELVAASQTVDHQPWLHSLDLDAVSGSSTKIVSTGDAWNKTLRPNGLSEDRLEIASVDVRLPKASDLGEMAWQSFQRQPPTLDVERSLQVLSLVPNYLRESAAVEKRIQESQR